MKSKLVQHPKGIEIHLSNRGILATFAIAAASLGGAGAAALETGERIGENRMSRAADLVVSDLEKQANSAIKEAAQKNLHLAIQNRLCTTELEGMNTALDIARFSAITQAKLTEAQRKHIELLETIIETDKTGVAPPAPKPQQSLPAPSSPGIRTQPIKSTPGNGI